MSLNGFQSVGPNTALTFLYMKRCLRLHYNALGKKANNLFGYMDISISVINFDLKSYPELDLMLPVISDNPTIIAIIDL